jgi:L-alanine-DL-glutamate epimerase-like enolase superfamily enzyme
MDTVPETFPGDDLTTSAETQPATPTLDGNALTIESIDVTPIVVPLEKEYRGSYYRMQNRSTVLTRVVTREGIVGEAYAGDEDATLREIVAVVTNELTPRLVGENGFSIERCWERGFPVTYDQLRDRRIGLVALASVDLALWDAIGKALNRPLWQLWGGYRDSIGVNIIGGYYGRDLDGIHEEVTEWRELGFHGCKFKVGGKDPAEDAVRVEAARSAAGDGFVLTIDANQGYSRAQALDLCGRVRDLDIRWFEEPCVWSNDARDMRDVRAAGGIPVCAGQSEQSPEGCRDLMEQGAIDVCNFDASWSGGYTNWKRMAAVARLYNVELAHHEEPQVAAHLLASQPHGTYLEVFHPDRDPIWWRMIANRPDLVDGALPLPAGPGLGWELDRDFIDRYRVEL